MCRGIPAGQGHVPQWTRHPLLEQNKQTSGAERGGQEVSPAPAVQRRCRCFGERTTLLLVIPEQTLPKSSRGRAASLSEAVSSNASTLTLTAWWEMDPLRYQTTWLSPLPEPREGRNRNLSLNLRQPVPNSSPLHANPCWFSLGQIAPAAFLALSKR